MRFTSPVLYNKKECLNDEEQAWRHRKIYIIRTRELENTVRPSEQQKNSLYIQLRFMHTPKRIILLLGFAVDVKLFCG